MKRQPYIWTVFMEDLWRPASAHLASNILVRRLLIVLTSIILVVNCISLIDRAFAPSPETESKNQLVHYQRQAQNEFQKIHTISRRVLDSLSRDSTVPFYSQYVNGDGIALFLRPYHEDWVRSVSASSLPSDVHRNTDVALAIYDASNKLRGWYSTDLSSPGFDTLYSDGAALSRKSTLFLIDSDAYNLWYINARKLLSAQGDYLGYVLLKYRIGRYRAPDGWQWNESDRGISYSDLPLVFHTVSPFQTTPQAAVIYIDTIEHTIPVGYFTATGNATHSAKTTSLLLPIKFIEGFAELLLLGLLFGIIATVILAKADLKVGRFLLTWSIAAIVLFALRAAIYYWGDMHFVLSYFLKSSKDIVTIYEPIEISISVIVLVLVLLLLQKGLRQLRPRLLEKAPVLSIYLLVGTGIGIPFLIILLEKTIEFLSGQYQLASVPLSLFICLTLITGLVLYCVFLLHRSLSSVFTYASTSRFFSFFILFLYLVGQVTVFVLLSTVTHFWLEWQVIISITLILSFFFASQADSQWYDTLRQALHPSIRSIVLLALAATVPSIAIQEYAVDRMIASAEREVKQLTEPASRSTQNPALSMVRALIAKVADTTVSPKIITIKTHRFIDSVLAHQRDWDISLDITAKGSAQPFLKIQSRYDLPPSDSNGDYRVRQLTDVAISRAALSDSTLSSAQVQSKRIALVYSLSILKRRGLGFLPSGHLDDIGWKRTAPDSDIVIPSGIIDLDNRTLLSGKIPAKISYMLDAPKHVSNITSITTKTIDDISYLFVFRPVVVADSSRQLAAATIVLPTLKQFIDSAAPTILFLFLASAIILLLILCWRWIHRQSFLSLQEKTLVTLFVIGIITSVIFANIIRKGISTESIRGFTQRLEQKKEFLYSERIVTLRSDSVYIFTSHLHQAAAALNCDLALYDDRNTLKESTCRTCYDLSLLPVTLPSTIVQQISLQSPKQVDGTTSILQQPVRYWATVLESPFGVKRPPYKLLLLQKNEAYPQFQQAVVARISSGVVGLLLLIIIIASYLSYRLARPINQLRLAAQIIAANSLEVSLPKKRRDEIGEMIESFDKMTVELSKGRERVAQSEREGAWKEMARQVAHEIKNPLTPMKLSIQHVQHAFEHQDTNFQNIFKRVVKTLTEQIDVLTRIATEFARFGEMPRRRYTFTSLTHIVDSALALFDAERSRIRFAIDIPKSLPAIYADEEEFRRTLVNLIKNAIQAIDKWGVILISAREHSGLIHLQITDSGAGMKEETLRKAFDPNFSTKTSGMGLGLAIVKKTITDMSGTIRVESKPGEGTTFFIELPARGEQPTGHS